MSTQIAVRLPAELVEFIDQLVQDGQASSRAAVVAQAVEREQRRAIAAQDAAILAEASTNDDLDDLADFASHIPMSDLD